MPLPISYKIQSFQNLTFLIVQQFLNSKLQLQTKIFPFHISVVTCEKVKENSFHFRYRSSSALTKQLFLSPRTAAFDVMVKRKRLNADDENDEDDADEKLTRLMRGAVHEALNLPENVIWGSQAGAVFDTLAGDFMKPVVETVEAVLNSTTVKVVVYSGQLDLICATPGTVEWVNNMKWYGSKDYANAPRNGIGVNNLLEGYSRRYGNFSMYWVSVD